MFIRMLVGWAGTMPAPKQKGKAEQAPRSFALEPGEVYEVPDTLGALLCTEPDDFPRAEEVEPEVAEALGRTARRPFERAELRAAG